MSNLNLQLQFKFATKHPAANIEEKTISDAIKSHIKEILDTHETFIHPRAESLRPFIPDLIEEVMAVCHRQHDLLDMHTLLWRIEHTGTFLRLEINGAMLRPNKLDDVGFRTVQIFPLDKYRR